MSDCSLRNEKSFCSRAFGSSIWPSMAAFMREVKRRFSEQQIRAPHYQTARRRIAALDQRLAMRKREGPKRARERFGPVGISTLSADLPMDIVPIDHTVADVMVVDREYRQSIGRPWLTLAVDVASRAVVGFSVSLESPSALSISLVLSHAVLPKTSWLADRELQNLDWPMAGLPRLIHVDNAKEFHSRALLRGCQEYGIAIEHRPRGQRHLGGHVERLVGTMMGAVHLLPGTTFSNASQKGSYDSEGRAVLTLPELERMAGAANCGGLPPHRAFGAGPDAFGSLAGRGGEKKAATSVSPERRRVLPGFPARGSAPGSERWHSFSPDPLLG